MGGAAAGVAAGSTRRSDRGGATARSRRHGARRRGGFGHAIEPVLQLLVPPGSSRGPGRTRAPDSPRPAGGSVRPVADSDPGRPRRSPPPAEPLVQVGRLGAGPGRGRRGGGGPSASDPAGGSAPARVASPIATIDASATVHGPRCDRSGGLPGSRIRPIGMVIVPCGDERGARETTRDRRISSLYRPERAGPLGIADCNDRAGWVARSVPGRVRPGGGIRRAGSRRRRG